ncbi:MAG TPA: DEAD/DEAH box helicase [Sporichthyaceae bacterium]|nr:DEAD/DEAH box helicase [Sporichthyaceae bacterium]
MPLPTLNPAPPAGFAALGVPDQLVDVLAARGIQDPSPIQTATLPDALAGRDILGTATTGSGKTLAFALPVVARLADGRRPAQPRRPRALILVPTRELANQVSAVLAPLAAASRLRVATVFGGVGQQPQVRSLAAGVDILVACPGRLTDLIGQGHCRLDAVQITVLDEADHMADLGFLPVVKRLLDQTPAGTQRLLFSATLDREVDVLERRYLVDPVRHRVEAPPGVSTVRHHMFVVAAEEKPTVVAELAAGSGRTLLFTGTKRRARDLAHRLTEAGIPAVDLHGNLSQHVRERNLAAFSAGRVRVLVATDIAARGIHVDGIDLVVHVDPPAEHKTWLHRSGRTARAGAEGSVVTLMSPQQRTDVGKLARRAGIDTVATMIAPGDKQIRDLTGPRVNPVHLVPDSVERPRAGAGRAPATAGRAPGRRSPSLGATAGATSAVELSRTWQPRRRRTAS